MNATKNDPKDEMAELKALMDAHDKTAAANKKLEEQIAEMAERQRVARIRDECCAALERAGCLKSEDTYRLVRDNLDVDDAGRVFARADEDGRGVDVPIEKYVETHVRRRVPEFFKDWRHASAPAGKDFDYTLDQIRNTEFYAANREAIADALSKGRVKMTA